MAMNQQTVVRPAESVLATNKVLRNTYLLLSMTLLFSAAMAFVGMQANVVLGPLVTLGGYFLLLFLTSRFANSGLGLVFVFALTGFLGFTLGPMLNAYLALPNGPQLVMTALGGTGVIFLGLSGYALTTRKDFSFLGGFLMAGLLVVIFAAIVGIFVQMPALQLAISSAVILLMSGFILYDTSRMVHQPNGNYLMMTVSLYLDILNLFVSLLHILGIFSSDD